MLQVQINAYNPTTGTNEPLQIDANGNLKTNNNKDIKHDPLTVAVENVIPTLTFAPDSQTSMVLFVGGTIQVAGTDYTLSGSTVTWIGAQTLTVGTTVDVVYMYTIT
jgi:hypothetical protein